MSQKQHDVYLDPFTRELMRAEKAMKFFLTMHGFTAPFNMLCDATFLERVWSEGVKTVVDEAEVLLGGACKLHSTKCVVDEFRRQFNILHEIEGVQTALCLHPGTVSSAECVSMMLAGNNPMMLFLGTAERDVYMRYNRENGVPVIVALRNKLRLLQPSKKQKKFAYELQNEGNDDTTETKKDGADDNVESEVGDDPAEAKKDGADDNVEIEVDDDPAEAKKDGTDGGLTTKKDAEANVEIEVYDDPAETKKDGTDGDLTTKKDVGANVKDVDGCKKRKL